MTDFKGNINILPRSIDVSFVSGLIQDVFGINTPKFEPRLHERSDQIYAFSGVELDDPGPEYDNAPVRYGQPTWGAFWLIPGDESYKIWNYEGKLVDAPLFRFLMPLATLVDFRRDKVINKTPVVGGTGSVKEIYSLDDWNIGINGIILPDKQNPFVQQTVEEQMEILQLYSEVAGSINVDGQIFARRNISRIVIENLTFSPLQGRPNMMQYTIDAISDGDILLSDTL